MMEKKYKYWHLWHCK